MKSVLVTGAGRGLGLTFTQKLLENGDRVFACVRDLAQCDELRTLASKFDQLRILQMNPCDPAEIQKAFEQVRSQTNSIDLLINNAGRYGTKQSSLEELDLDDMQETMRVNLIAPILVLKRFMSLVEQSHDKKVVLISSKMGSIEDNQSGASYAYRISKTALNQLCKTLAVQYQNKGVICIAMHPGWVQTAMGGKNAPIDRETSVKGMLHVIEHLRIENTGQFLDYQNKAIPF